MRGIDFMLEMTALGKTWLLDLDGTLVKHNGYKLDGKDTLLPDIGQLLAQIHPEDTVVILTSRKREQRKETEFFLQKHGIPYDHIIFELPYGERILINDKKPSGRKMAFAVNTQRDEAYRLNIIRNSEI